MMHISFMFEVSSALLFQKKKKKRKKLNDMWLVNEEKGLENKYKKNFCHT